MLTGHTLMVGDLGRTELATDAEQGARDLYRSAQKLMALPDYLEVYPGAFSGSVCGRALSGKPVIMKIDLVGPVQRGLAMGLNEFAGYMAAGLTTLASGYIASQFGLRPQPFYMGIAFAVTGLALSLLFVRETLGHARALPDAPQRAPSVPPPHPLPRRTGHPPSAWRPQSSVAPW